MRYAITEKELFICKIFIGCVFFNNKLIKRLYTCPVIGSTHNHWFHHMNTHTPAQQAIYIWFMNFEKIAL